MVRHSTEPLPLVIATAERKPIKELTSYEIDIAWGESENNFELTTDSPLEAGQLIWMDGTAAGGIIDTVQTKQSKSITYKGRTWHGIMASRIVQPPSGADYKTVSGDLNAILRSLIADAGLSSLFTVSQDSSGISIGSTQIDRYVSLLSALLKLLRNSSATLLIDCSDNQINLSIRKSSSIRADSERVEFTAARDHHPVNHLIGLGKGELKAREIIHRYADRDGNISAKQTLFGIDEVQATYELSNKSGRELITGVEQQLKALQTGANAVDLDFTGDTTGIEIGDCVTASDAITGITTTARTVKKIIKVNHDMMTVQINVGNGTTSQNTSGETNTGNNATALAAGRGITITDGTINAEVTASDLKNLKGDKGDPGTAATIAVAGTITGEPHSDAQVSNSGTSTNAQLTFTIPRGADGEAATVKVGTVTTGNPGTSATVTNSGTSTNAVLNFTIPQGAKGDTGDAANITSAVMFKAAHPVGSLFHTTRHVSPVAYAPGTTWLERDSINGFTYERTS